MVQDVTTYLFLSDTYVRTYPGSWLPKAQKIDWLLYADVIYAPISKT